MLINSFLGVTYELHHQLLSIRSDLMVFNWQGYHNKQQHRMVRNL